LIGHSFSRDRVRCFARKILKAVCLRPATWCLRPRHDGCRPAGPRPFALALPLIDEELFAVHLLKEMFGLTDAEALEQLEFSLLWHHALELTPEEAHLPQKTLHNFRARLLARDSGREAFAATTDRILEALGTQVSRQRLDSTHVISNIAVLSRLGLFCETIRHFLSILMTEHPRLYGRYLKEDGGATGYQDKGQRRLSVCARDLYRLCKLFAGTAAEGLEAFGLVQRLLDEQCNVIKKKQRPSRDDDDSGEGGVPVVLKAPKKVSSGSLQSPHDPEVTYNARKGKGYGVQIAETCHEDNRRGSDHTGDGDRRLRQ
jgi:hypothetical protein